MTRNVTPAVEATARRRGVDLGKVTGTGAGGRITVSDVVAAADRQGTSSDDAVYASLFGSTAPAGSRPVAAAGPVPVISSQRSSVFAGHVTVTLDPYGCSPLVDDVRQASPIAYAAATREAQAPTLFESGDLPLFTTSGIDPQLLLRLPWQARHPAARAERVDAQRIFEEYAPNGTPDDALDKAALADMAFSDDPGNFDYAARVQRWAVGLAAAPSYGT
jgi:hypothetical protein